MATSVNYRRGTTTQHNNFAGVVAELTVDTTKDTVVVHDGSTLGGFPLAREDLNNVSEIPVSKLADGTSRQLLQTAANGTDVEWTSNVDVPGTLDVTGAATFDSNVTITGSLVVNGSTTTINSTVVSVDDKLIELGSTASPTDASADQGGILLKGTTDKSIKWIDSTDAWTSSEHVDLASGKAFYINGTQVLSSTALGSNVLITSSNITDGTIVNADVNASAAIAGTKISPDFGNQTVTTTGVISPAPGTAALPSIAFTGDPNTGLYSPAADQVAISTGGTGRLFVNASGNVGIGTNSPQQALHALQSGGNSFAGIRSQNSNSGTGIAGIEFSSDSTYAKSAIGLVRSDTNGVGSLVFYNASSTGAANWSTTDERLRITADGKVGIGTSSPTAFLNVAGGSNTIPAAGATGASALFGNNLSANTYGLALGATTAGIGYIQAQRADGVATTYNLSLQPNGGNVGIGTSSPTLLLDINGSTATSNGGLSNAQLYAGLPPTGGGNAWGGIVAGAGINGNLPFIAASRNGAGAGLPLAFYTDGTERMRITSGGYTKSTNNGSYHGSTGAHHESYQTADAANHVARSTNASLANTVYYAIADRAANSAYFFFVGTSGWGGAADDEFKLYGDGNGKCDGAWTGGGADYAEYFEWSDANPTAEDRRGISVVLDGDKIREAQPGEDPIGVISGNPSVVGDAAWNKWSGKYLRDEYGTYIQEDYEVEDEDGNTVIQQRRKLNPAYDPDMEYVSREQRPEWDCVGLMGKLRIRKGQVTGSRWIKMRDINNSVEEWLVR